LNDTCNSLNKNNRMYRDQIIQLKKELKITQNVRMVYNGNSFVVIIGNNYSQYIGII